MGSELSANAAQCFAVGDTEETVRIKKRKVNVKKLESVPVLKLESNSLFAQRVEQQERSSTRESTRYTY